MGWFSTEHEIEIKIKNDTDSNGSIILYHKNSDFGSTNMYFDVKPRATIGPLKVKFNTGPGSYTVLDYWSVVLTLTDGVDYGEYTSGGSFIGSDLGNGVAEKIGLGSGVVAGATTGFLVGGIAGAVIGGAIGGVAGDKIGSNFSPNWKECQLQTDDVGTTPVFTVDTKTFNIDLESGSTDVDMEKSIVTSKIDHIFVLMLENHSFDNIFAMSGIPDIVCATTQNLNSYNTQHYHVSSPAPVQMHTDPGHEFDDVLEQLTGQKSKQYGADPAPTISNNGFAKNYATSDSESTGLPTGTEIGDVMKCFDTPNQLPVIHQLATEFAICDHWFSAMPGPTWPNRFFVHGATSSGMDDSQTKKEEVEWLNPLSGFIYEKGSIYDSLGGDFLKHLNWRI